MHGHGAGHADDVLRLARGADGHLLQGEGAAAGGAFFEDDVIAAQFAIAQIGADQQTVQGLFCWQRPAYTRGRNVLPQLCRQTDLPASDRRKVVERSHQRLLGNRKFIIAHSAAFRWRIGRSYCRNGMYASHQQGDGQQRQSTRVRRAGATLG